MRASHLAIAADEVAFHETSVLEVRLSELAMKSQRLTSRPKTACRALTSRRPTQTLGQVIEVLP